MSRVRQIEGTDQSPAVSGKRGPSGTEPLVLFVDDETAITELSRIILSNHGYRVLTASTVQEALTLLQAHENEIDVAVVDLNLPDGKGSQRLADIAALAPMVPVIVSSGDDLAALRSEDPFLMNRYSTLQKPWSPKQLLEKISEALATSMH